MESLYVPSNGVISKGQITKRAKEKFRPEDTNITTFFKGRKSWQLREKKGIVFQLEVAEGRNQNKK